MNPADLLHMKETWSFNNDIQRKVIRFAEENLISLQGDMLNNQLLFLKEENDYIRYVEVIAPLKK